ncbi:MAG: ABC transporter ATP-binding protein [Geminicoccaceae bacterium]
MARIELSSVTKSWGDVVAVEPTDLVIEDGELVAILGPSGCGKSTTLFMLAGIYAPSGGELRFDGAVVNEVEARHRNVGIVFQSYALYPHMNVRRNIMFPLKFKGVPAADARRRAEETARLVQVEDLLDRTPGQMSGGQQQRVALARALVKEPQLLLLDEPLSNLDATLRLTMRSEIKRLQRQLAVTTILVTHDQIEATTMADRIVCMSKGRIEQVGTADDLFLRPRSLFVASFIGAPPINLIDSRVARGRLRLGEMDLHSQAPDGDVVLGVRPENITLGDPDGENVVRADVVQIEPMGRETLYVLDSVAGRIHVLEHGTVRRFREGDRVGCDLPLDGMLLFDRASGLRIEAPALARAA